MGRWNSSKIRRNNFCFFPLKDDITLMETNTTTLAETYSDLFYKWNERFVRKLNEYLQEQESIWFCYTDIHTGCIYLEKHAEYEENAVVYATPFYENQQAIQVDISFHYAGTPDNTDFTCFIAIERSELKPEPTFENLFKLYVNHLPVIFALFEAKKLSLR